MKKLYTHTDLDGAACAVLARLAWGGDVDVTYCRNPREVTEHLQKLSATDGWKKFDLIYVTDLSFDAGIIPDIGSMVKTLRLLDHHATSEHFAEYKWATVKTELNGRFTCGAELFQQYLVERYQLQPRNFFVEQVRLYDTWDWAKGTSRLPQYLSNVVFKLGLRYFDRTYTERLRAGDLNELNLFNQYERDILAYDEKREQKDLAMFLKQAYICEIETPFLVPDRVAYKVGMVFNSSFYTSALGNLMCKELGVDIAFCVNLNRGVIEVRTADDSIDVGHLMKERYQGGGHAKAAGGYIAEVPEEVARKILSALGVVKSVRQVV